MSWEISWADMCRACMEVEGELFSLYDDSSEISDLSTKLAELSSIEIDKSDGLPTKLCEICAYRTNAFFEFKRLVRDSDKKLRHMFNQQMVSNTKDDLLENGINSTCDVSEIPLQQKNNISSSIDKNSTTVLQSKQKKIIKTELNDFEEISDTIILKVVNDADKTSDINNEIHVVFHPNELNTVSNFNKSHCNENQNNSEIEQSVILTSKVEGLKNKNNFEDVSNNDLETSSQIVNKSIEENEIQENSSNSNSVQLELDDSDSDSYTDTRENIVGSLNDTITKVKEIKEAGRIVQYQCTLCLQNYEVLSEVLTHIVDFHVPSTGPFYCVVCELDCDSIKQLKAHVKIHKGPSPYICFLCNKAYITKRYLKRHMACHTDFPRHRCAKCGERFKVKNELEAHITSHTQDAPFRCSQCPRVFNHKGNYKRHLISHLDPQGVHLPKYPCNICNRRFLNNRTLTNHMRVHTGEKPYKCEICNKSFSQQGNLLNHQKIHTNPRSFTCEVCGKSFNQKATLRDHSLLHSGEKPYICTVCGVAFTFSAALRRHMWTHSEGKPFECDVCNAKFIGRYDLKRHVKIHSGRPKLKQNKTKTKEDNTVEVSEEIVNIVQDTSNTDTIFVEQIFLCDDTIQIISQDSEKENVDALFGLIQYT